MRVLLLPHRYPPLGRGGVETWARNLALGLRDLGVQVAVASRDDRGIGMPFAVREDRVDEVPVYWIVHRHADARHHRDTWSDPRMGEALRSIVRAARPDVLHLAHPDGFGIEPLRIARDLGVPLVVTLHDAKWWCGRGQMVAPGGTVCERADEERCARCLGDQLDRGPVRAGLARIAPSSLRLRMAARDDQLAPEARRDPGALARRRWRVRRAALRTVLQGADAILSPSRFLAELATAHGCDRPITILSNGVAPGPAAMDWPKGPLKIGWFGVPSPTKGLAVLLRAVRLMEPGSFDLQLHGVTSDELIALDSAPLPPGVRAMGRYSSSDASTRMGAVHVVVLPSTWPENQPMVALEARAAGRPLLASRIGGLPELIRDGHDGWLVPAGDPQALASRLRRLAANPHEVCAAAEAIEPPQNIQDLARAYVLEYGKAAGHVFPSFDRESAPPAQ